MNRRQALKTIGVGAANLLTAGASWAAGLPQAAGGSPTPRKRRAYDHRIAFGAWANDMRNTALPLQQWPAPQFDDRTVEGIVRTIEAIGESGYGYLDTFGLYATRDYPPDIVSAFADRERNRRLDRIFGAADQNGIGMVVPLGLMTWGYDRIVREDPEVRGKDHEGKPHPSAMCGAQEKSWAYIEKLIDTMFTHRKFAAVHLESADLGYCMCAKCVGQFGVVGYNARLNARAADYIKGKWPDVLVYVCPINWVPWELDETGKQRTVSAEDFPHIVELSRHIDVFVDQGHRGRILGPESIESLRSAYGTSGGLWLYHGARQDRLSYFLPYPMRAARHLAAHYDQGARACLYYQGPMVNPAVEMTSAIAGRIMAHVDRDPREALEDFIDRYYRPRNAEAARSLAEVFLTAEEAYFGQWDEQRFKDLHKNEMPGEFTLGVLFGTVPDPAGFLTEPFLDSQGRAACKSGLKKALATAGCLEGQFNDGGRVDRISRCLTVMLHLLTTVMMVKGEGWAE